MLAALFQSTPSVGRATVQATTNAVGNAISIHALRGEGDDRLRFENKEDKEFQSTPSVGRATAAGGIFAAGQRHFNPRPPWGGRQFSC